MDGSTDNSSIVLTLGGVVRNQSSGILTFISEKVARQFTFANGHLTQVVCNAKSELPGSFLHKEGKLTKEQYESYLQKIKAPKPNFWSIALSLTTLSPGDVAALKAKYAARQARSLLSSKQNIQYLPTEPPTSEPKIMDGLKLCIELFQELPVASAKNICPDFEKKSSIFFDEKLEKKLSPLPLSPEEKGLITVLQHNNVVSEVFSSSFIGEEKITRLLLAFWACGLVRLESAETTVRKKHEDILSPENKALVQDLKRTFHELSKTSYYDWLKVSPSAKSEDIQTTFQSRIEFLSSPKLPNLFFGDERTIPDLLIQKLKEAATVLLNTDQRQEYDQYLGSGKTGSFLGTSVVGKEHEVLHQFEELWSSGNKSKALEQLEKSLKEFPKSIKLIVAFANSTLEQSGGKDSAKKDSVLAHLKKGLETWPTSVEILESLGNWMAALNQNAKAVEAYKRALMIFPFSKPAIEGLEKISPDSIGQISVQAVYKGHQESNYYALLGITERASFKEIQTAYRNCTKRFHPDRFFKTEDAELKQMANEIYKRMVKAYTTLKNSSKRSEYNKTLNL